MLHALLVGPLRLTPIDTERRRGYEFAGLVALDRLIAGVMDLPLRTRVVVASPVCASWNQMTGWLRAVDSLRQAA